MKYHLETIPVWDAYHQGGECPLCTLESECERQYLDAALGGAVMEPDARVETNAKGFCDHHLGKMLTMGNRLGLSLMAHTHLLDVISALNAKLTALEGAAEKGGAREAIAGLAKKAAWQKSAAEAGETLSQRLSTCAVCEKIQNTMERYLYTVIHLHGSDPAFSEAFADSSGVCLPHCAALLDMASAQSGAGARKFALALSALQKRELNRLAGELEWFTLKFDYRNQSKPWGTSQDAPDRTLQKLRGARLRAERKGGGAEGADDE